VYCFQLCEMRNIHWKKIILTLYWKKIILWVFATSIFSRYFVSTVVLLLMHLPACSSARPSARSWAAGSCSSGSQTACSSR